ncbi:hypothetical protein OGAPHI_005334 [Ogataea philodendri]|uniref:ethanolamine-phosphate cytidylyltransferase n=1 Tax=Ogataea philodendri TaxID=1378263 RepID=A0A9P8P280_9ASCO|nr:uncharacterized protein OGAPHI_005334 [Ogataea philodendri]KAH3663344.1 hypothetical protein OGAPHI_005334 [Ogataea philodendri]
MLQARQHGDELFVGVHSDEDILENKGPVVMTLKERLAAVDGCRWATQSVPGAPYVTDPQVMDSYRCKYVVHGDDITTDANGEDCYKTMKELGRFIVVKRTPNISTTDLVGRMLLYSKNHHLAPISSRHWDEYAAGEASHELLLPDAVQRYRAYATCEDGKNPGVAVYVYTEDTSKLHELVEPSGGRFASKNIYYIDGGFDLFNPGHIVALKTLKERAVRENAVVLVGVNSDDDVNRHKGLNYPIMNLFERSLCVLQSAYIDGIVLGAPYKPTAAFLASFDVPVAKVFHGPTSEHDDPYDDVKQLGLYENLGRHEYDHISTEDIASRVLKNRAAYEERQRRKGWKSEHERQLEQQEKK